jgi:hypothetical protein
VTGFLLPFGDFQAAVLRAVRSLVSPVDFSLSVPAIPGLLPAKSPGLFSLRRNEFGAAYASDSFSARLGFGPPKVPGSRVASAPPYPTQTKVVSSSTFISLLHVALVFVRILHFKNRMFGVTSSKCFFPFRISMAVEPLKSGILLIQFTTD